MHDPPAPIVASPFGVGGGGVISIVHYTLTSFWVQNFRVHLA